MLKKPQNKKPKITLSVEGVARPIKEWAEIVAYHRQQTVQKSEWSIRERLKRRQNGDELTDAQVVWGREYTSGELPDVTDGGLSAEAKRWAEGAVQDILPVLAEKLAAKAARYCAGRIRQLAASMGVDDPESAVPSDLKSDMVRQLLQEESPVLHSGRIGYTDPRRQAASQWLSRNGHADLVEEGKHLSERLAEMLVDDDPADDELEHYFQGLKGFEAPPPNNPAPVSTNNPLDSVRSLWIQAALQGREYAPFKVDASDDISEAEEAKILEDALWRAFSGEDMIPGVSQPLSGRLVLSKTDFNALVANPWLFDRLPDSQGDFAAFAKLCLTDLVVRAAMKVSDHRTFNRAQEVFFVSRALKRVVSNGFRPKEPELPFWERLVVKLIAWELDLCVAVHAIPNPVGAFEKAMEEWSRLASDLKPFMDWAEKMGYTFATRDAFARPEDESYGISPIFLPDSEMLVDQVDALNCLATNGRNLAHWPKPFTEEVMKVMPVEVYYDEDEADRRLDVG